MYPFRGTRQAHRVPQLKKQASQPHPDSLTSGSLVYCSSPLSRCSSLPLPSGPGPNLPKLCHLSIHQAVVPSRHPYQPSAQPSTSSSSPVYHCYQLNPSNPVRPQYPATGHEPFVLPVSSFVNSLVVQIKLLFLNNSSCLCILVQPEPHVRFLFFIFFTSFCRNITQFSCIYL